ncbi:MAG: alpha/beta hydrolase-fold protein [Nocardioides sp.]|uniref:alpha/beta hydrolase-fold protein n=1 Tax=Nocardioides sp. TaxID=35761 RepID=UPI0039E4016D
MPMSRRDLTRAFAVTVGSATLLGTTELTTTELTTANAATQRTHKRTTTATRSHDRSTRYPPLITHTHHRPTGYEVTFRYHAPDATRVQLKGEWYFERPSDLPERLSGPDGTVETPGLRPRQWRRGDVPIASPNSTSPNWPVVDMRKGRDGVWSYTTPLPGGVYTYGFFIDADADDTTTTGLVPDPSNPAWNVHDGVVDGRAVDRSQIYVPSDADFDPRETSWLSATDGASGKLRYVTYDSPGHVTPADQNYLVVYTPPGYDAHRATPYPTLYLSHGGGEDEMGWSTQGALADIMDQLIGRAEIEPMLVVMPNATGYATSSQESLHRADLIERVIPWMEEHYHVVADASGRAYSGLSAGGMRTAYLLLDNTAEFGYYGLMSAGLPPDTTFSDDLVTAMKQASVWIGGGWQDPINAGFVLNGTALHRGPFRAARDLTEAGVHVTTAFIDGGHEWYVWRLLLRDFLTRVAFLPATSAPDSWGA